MRALTKKNRDNTTTITMKDLLFLISVLCCICLGAAKVGEVCEFNTECDVGECCVHIHSFTHARCRKLRPKNEFCFPDPQTHLIEKEGVAAKYKFMCPCIEGLKCEAEEVKELESGVIEFRNSRCV